MRAIREMRRQDKVAERTGTVPAYQRGEVIDITPSYMRNAAQNVSNSGQNTNNTSQNSSSSKK